MLSVQGTRGADRQRYLLWPSTQVPGLILDIPRNAGHPSRDIIAWEIAAHLQRFGALAKG